MSLKLPSYPILTFPEKLRSIPIVSPSPPPPPFILKRIKILNKSSFQTIHPAHLSHRLLLTIPAPDRADSHRTASKPRVKPFSQRSSVHRTPRCPAIAFPGHGESALSDHYPVATHSFQTFRGFVVPRSRVCLPFPLSRDLDLDSMPSNVELAVLIVRSLKFKVTLSSTDRLGTGVPRFLQQFALGTRKSERNCQVVG